MQTESLEADVLVIGGGTAGCAAAIELGRAGRRVLVVEKANIRRSGCLAAGVNALNAYITRGHTPQDYVDYARRDAAGIIRGDLELTMSEGLNGATRELEDLGLVILKDENGEYVARGQRNIKINGENIKPLLARAVAGQKSVRVLNHVNVTDYLLDGDRVCGAVGFGVRDGRAYVLRAGATIIATGGAAGLYRPNNPGFSRHKMWYPPFNTGAGYAMGIEAGAEMTTFEMRFIALRCKDTIAPTGTIAQGAHAPQVNALGENYEQKYGLSTSQRVWGTTQEGLEGRGPCYLKTEGISAQAERDLYRAYLNMAPSQTLRWIEQGAGPATRNVEVEGTEPYVVGGHTASGYWVDTDRATTLPGLFAAGDVAGGCPQKYVTGALVEGKIAARSAARWLERGTFGVAPGASTADAMGAAGVVGQRGATPPAAEERARAIIEGYAAYLARDPREATFTCDELEEAMQKVMDEYAGGISARYRFNGRQLALAAKQISELKPLAAMLAARDPGELMRIFELRERLTVCEALIAHLGARHETRWHSFDENADYPQMSDDGLCYINSRRRPDGTYQIIRRDLVGEGERYEHQNRS